MSVFSPCSTENVLVQCVQNEEFLLPAIPGRKDEVFWRSLEKTDFLFGMTAIDNDKLID